MFRVKKILRGIAVTTLTSFLCFGVGVFSAEATSDTVIVTQNVETCTTDGICSAGENGNTCPIDCHIACDDNLDNDSDGLTDFPADPGCSSATDTDEYNPPTSVGIGGSGFGTSYIPGNIFFRDIHVVPSALAAQILWTTNTMSSAKVYWGKTREYEEGSLSSIFFEHDHSALLSHLLPGTLYYYKIVARTPKGSTATETGSFFTQNPSGSYEVPNVSNLSLSGSADGIVVAWENPKSKYFDSVVVVRKTSGYPQGPNDGTLVYEGKGEFFYDKDVRLGQKYYYGVFAKSVSGRYASGALGTLTISKSGHGETGNGSETVSTNPPGKELGEGPMGQMGQGERVRLRDFLFLQNGETTRVENHTIELKAGYPFSVLFPKASLPANVVSVIFERTSEKTEKLSSFLLSTYDHSGVLRALLPAYFKKGTYPFKAVVTIPGGNYYVLSGNITIPNSALIPQSTRSGTIGIFQFFLTYWIWIVVIFILLILALIFLLFGLRRRDQEDEEQYTQEYF